MKIETKFDYKQRVWAKVTRYEDGKWKPEIIEAEIETIQVMIEKGIYSEAYLLNSHGYYVDVDDIFTSRVDAQKSLERKL